jgi:hypothetical protein
VVQSVLGIAGTVMVLNKCQRFINNYRYVFVTAKLSFIEGSCAPVLDQAASPE